MTQTRIKIFVSAYACEPNQGSEIGVGWHWVLEMAKHFDLWVLTRRSNQKTIEDWLVENPQTNPIHFVYYDLPPKLRFWKKGLRGVRLYYVLWQRLTNNIVRRTMEQNSIEIYHLLTYGNALWPVSHYGQRRFFVWGPVGTGDTIPRDFSCHYPLRGRVIEEIRRFSVKVLPLNLGFKSRCNKAALILCKTENSRQSIPTKYRHKAITFTDVAVEMPMGQYIESTRISSDPYIRYVAVGRLDAWRGFDLLIEAFAHAHRQNQHLRLEILGRGPDHERLNGLITKFGMTEVICLVGQVSMEEYQQKMAGCDVVVNPALKEGAVTVSFDSMGYGKPLICVDTGGYTRYFSNEYAVVLPRTGREEVVSKLCDALLFYTDEKKRKIHGELAAQKSKQLGWEDKGKQIAECIRSSFANKPVL